MELVSGSKIDGFVLHKRHASSVPDTILSDVILIIISTFANV